jgi:hypothetical protein
MQSNTAFLLHIPVFCTQNVPIYERKIYYIVLYAIVLCFTACTQQNNNNTLRHPTPLPAVVTSLDFDEVDVI